jgi:hypothetical protein
VAGQKAQADERTRVPLPGPFRAFIEGGVALCETHAQSAPTNQTGPERLNDFFRQTILCPMTIDDLKARNLILLECISGSKAYGTDLPTSDTDIKGVFVLPRRTITVWNTPSR